MAERPLALITGASAGIGACLAREAANDGYDVLLIARRREKLDALARELNATAHIFTADLTQPDAPQAIMEEVNRLGRTVDVLINNAAFGASGPFLDFPRERQVSMVDLNIRAVVDLTYRVLPGMVAAGRGGIMNLSSTAAFQPGPRMAVYYASKSFVLSFSQAIAYEMRPHGIAVTAVCPGPTESEFGAVSKLDGNHLFRTMPKMTAEDVAALAWRGFRNKRRVVVTGWKNQVAVFMTKASPHVIKFPVIAWLHSNPK